MVQTTKTSKLITNYVVIPKLEAPFMPSSPRIVHQTTKGIQYGVPLPHPPPPPIPHYISHVPCGSDDQSPRSNHNQHTLVFVMGGEMEDPTSILSGRILTRSSSHKNGKSKLGPIVATKKRRSKKNLVQIMKLEPLAYNGVAAQ